MYKQEVIEYFGSKTKTAKALGITHSAVCYWKEIIPELSAIKLEKMTQGALKYDENLYKNKKIKKRVKQE
ncbi:MAG: Cro/Cl family transcriptional regulator [Neisseriaceae bacterium]|nr:Cro/Cl family transcriptional regulator [Neisseriaceae bacterium]